MTKKLITVKFVEGVVGNGIDYAFGQVVALPADIANKFIKTKFAIKVGADGEAKQTIVELNGQIDVLEKTIAAYEVQIEKLVTVEKAFSELNIELKTANDLNEVLIADIETFKVQLSDAEKQIADLLHSETGDAETGDVETGDAETGDAETGDAETGDVETGDVETTETDTKPVEPTQNVSPKIETKPDGTKTKAMPKKKTQQDSN